MGTTASPEDGIRILKSATCPSLSGKSKLTYHVGANAKGEILLRVHANSSTGFFSPEWIAYHRIQQLFAKVPEGKAITSYVLGPLYEGKSVNTPSFLFAALKNEGLVDASKVTRRQYDRLDAKPFLSMVKALVNAPPKANGRPRQAAHKPEAPTQNKKRPPATGKAKKAA